jgi:protein-tyrosine kinase
VAHVTEVRRREPTNGTGGPTNCARSSSLGVAELVREGAENRRDGEFTLGIEVSHDDVIASERKTAESVSAGDDRTNTGRRTFRSWWSRLLRRADTVPDESGLIAHREGLAESNQQFALLASRLRRWAEEQNKRTILITSALPAEGKSFVALNLATALAEAESDVLLVDADLRRPSLHGCLNVTSSYGLSEYLSGNIDLACCLNPTYLPRLTLLPGGNTPRSGSSVFAGLRLRELVRSLRALSSAPLVLFDAPPILTAPEVQILADFLDAVMIVVAANRTPRAVFLKALESVKETPLFGVVLNRFEPSFSAARAVRKGESGHAAAATGQQAAPQRQE